MATSDEIDASIEPVRRGTRRLIQACVGVSFALIAVVLVWFLVVPWIL